MSTPKRLHIGMSLAPTWLSGDAWRRPDSNIEGIFGSDFAVDIARRPKPPTSTSCFARTSAARHWTCWRPAPASPAWIPPYCLPRSPAKPRGSACVDGLHHVLSVLRGGPAAAIAALDQQRPRRLEHRHRAAGPRELRPGRDARCGAALRARRRVHPAGARPVGQLPREALLVDRESGRYADVSRVRPVDHDGEFLKVKGPLNLPAFGEAGIPLVQAGASERARLRRLGGRPGVRADSGQGGCPGTAPRPFPPRRTPRSLAARRAPAAGLQPVPGGEPRGGAGNLHADPRAPGPRAQVRHDQADARPRPQRLAAGPADFRGRPAAAGGQPRQPHPHRPAAAPDRARDVTPGPVAAAPRGGFRGALAGHRYGGRCRRADRRLAGAGAMDGFIAAPGGSVGSLRLFLEQVVPRLVEKGLFRERYSATTFAGHLAEE